MKYLRRPWHWIRRWQAAIIVLVIYIAIGVVGLYAVLAVKDERNDRTEAILNRQHQACLERAADREALRQTIIIATSGSASSDLTTVPGFEALDPTTQNFVRNLSMRASTQSPEQRKARQDELLSQLPRIECPVEQPKR